jgi:hypothetical protein
MGSSLFPASIPGKTALERRVGIVGREQRGDMTLRRVRSIGGFV